jgi:hypothetical protein
MKILKGIAICSNCNKKHYTVGKKINRKCQCGYYISAIDFKELCYI